LLLLFFLYLFDDGKIVPRSHISFHVVKILKVWLADCAYVSVCVRVDAEEKNDARQVIYLKQISSDGKTKCCLNSKHKLNLSLALLVAT
jgi:hypothetical protein